MSSTFDVIIIGGGPGGYFAAQEAAKAGLKTAVFEEVHMGGTCLNEGCVPTKTLLNSVKIYKHAKEGANIGIKATGLEYDHKAAVARKEAVIKMLVSGVDRSVKKAGAEIIRKRAVIKEKAAEGFVIEADGEAYTGKNLIIATGSVTSVPPIEGLKEALASGFAVTSRELLDLQEVPKHLCIIGAGVIGLEFASYFSAAGAKVTMIEMLDHIGVNFESELSSLMQKKLEKAGCEFFLSSAVKSLTADSVCYEKDGQMCEVKPDLVMLCIGRRPNSANIGYENIRITAERGAIRTDCHMQTNVPGFYAVGDVNGKIALAHTAYREAAVAVNHILGIKDTMRYEAVPAVIYSDPELASVGYTLENAKAAGFDAKAVRVDANFSGRFLAENEAGEGFLKLIVDKKSERVLGMHVCSTYASEFIAQGALAIEAGLTIRDLKEIVYPHPTVCELIREAAFSYK